MQEAVARLEEFKKSVEAKKALRQSNLNPERPGQYSHWNNYRFSIYILGFHIEAENLRGFMYL